MAFDSAPSAVHLDQLLTGLTLNWVSEQNYLADKVFPVVNVSKKSDDYYTFDAAEANREGSEVVTLLAPRTEPRKFDVSHGQGTYNAKVYGAAFDIDMQTAANEDENLNVRSRKARQLMDIMLKKRDRDFISTFMTTGVWGVNLNGSTSDFVQWDDSASTPIDDVRNWKRAFQIRNYGFKPNVMVVTQDIVDTLMANTQILNRINGGATIGNPALIDMTLLAQIFGVEKVLIADAVSNNVAVGATAAPAYMISNQILLAYSPSEAGLDTPASGLIFAWNSIPNVSWGISMESFTDDALARQQIAEQVHAKMAYDMKAVGTPMGTYLSLIHI